MSHVHWVVLILQVCAAAAALTAPPPALAQVCLPPLFSCQTPPRSGTGQPPAADPGGTENVPAPLPPRGRYFGFSSNLSHMTSLRRPISAAQEANLSKQLGANAHRLVVVWKYLQYRRTDPPLPSDPNAVDGYLRRIDLHYQALVRRGLTPVVVPMAAPKWASRFDSCGWLDWACKREGRRGWDDLWFPDQAHLNHWWAFVAAVARRYPAAIIEGWNEPNYAGGAWVPEPEEFNGIQCTAYRAVKSVDPKRRVVGPSLLHVGWEAFSNYTARMYEAGAAGCWDAFNTHVYFDGSTQFGAGSVLAQVLAGVRAVKRSYGDHDQIWITETGWPTAGSGSDRPISESAHAGASSRLYNRLMSMHGVKAMFFYTARDLSTGDSDSVLRHYGFTRENFTPKSAYCVFVRRAGGRYSGC